MKFRVSSSGIWLVIVNPNMCWFVINWGKHRIKSCDQSHWYSYVILILVEVL